MGEMIIASQDPIAKAVVDAIHTGNIETLASLLDQHAGLASARIGDPSGCARTLLHVACDWPGHFPNGAAAITLLLDAGAEVNGRFFGPHTETPLHWAASSDDVDALEALIAGGADLEASGAVIAGGTPLDDAVAFAQWSAAHRLVEHGAQTALWHAAALGLMDELELHLAGDAPAARYPWGASASVAPDPVQVAFWCACHGGHMDAAQVLLARGADLDWASPWDQLTPLDAAEREHHADVVAWLRSLGATSAQMPVI